jgi:hypothetical protein
MVSANFDKIVSFGTPAIKADSYLTTESLLDIQEGSVTRF